MTTTPGCHHHQVLFFVFFQVLLLLLFLPPSLSCVTSPSTECDTLPFVPGHNLVGEGFDVVKMKTTGAFVVDTTTHMVGGEHGNCTICHNSLLGQRQKLPVSVVDWRVRVQCRRSLSTQIYESSQEVLKENAKSSSSSWKIGLSLGGLFGFAIGGTHSKSSKFAKGLSAKDKYSYTRHDFSCRYYTFRLHTHPSITKEFEKAIRSLPMKYNSITLPAYQQFISVYGTHYLRQVKLGGRVRSTTAIRTCKLAMHGLSVHDVSNCLSVEAMATIKGVTVSAATNFCKAKGKKLKQGRSFSSTFSERVTDVLGGQGQAGDLLFAPEKKSSYNTWLASLKMVPGVVSYSLTSLHMLVDQKKYPVKRENLRKAFSAYIKGYALPISCPSGCAVGRRAGNCACKCNGHKNVDSNCCPSKPGLASVFVVVERATGLWGDYFTKTDGYVKVFYGKQGSSTPVIMNNNFPQWNYKISFGTVDLGWKTPLRFEVWDRDNVWDDDLLGKVSLVPTKGQAVGKRFQLKHGSLYVSVSAACAPSLTGPFCARYSPSPQAVGGLHYQQELPPGGHAWGQTPRKHAWGNALL